jgi:hypothetical protein
MSTTNDFLISLKWTKRKQSPPPMVKLTKELKTSQTSVYSKLTQKEDKTTLNNYLNN